MKKIEFNELTTKVFNDLKSGNCGIRIPLKSRYAGRIAETVGRSDVELYLKSISSTQFLDVHNNDVYDTYLEEIKLVLEEPYQRIDWEKLENYFDIQYK